MTEQVTQVVPMPIVEVRHSLCGAIFYNGPLITIEDNALLAQRWQAHKVLCKQRLLIPETVKGDSAP